MEPKSHDSVSMTELITNAGKLLDTYCGPHASKDDRIPYFMIKEARGIAFFWNYQFSIGATASMGSGLLIARKPDSQDWGMPIALGLGGVGIGIVLGAHKDEQVVLLMSDNAVKTMCKHNLKYGADLTVALGPTGVKEDAGTYLNADGSYVEAYSYGHAQGLSMGGGLKTQIISPMFDKNAAFYGVKPHSEGGPSAEELVLGGALEGKPMTDAIVHLHEKLVTVQQPRH